jgi:hypothetical protein
MVKGIVRATPTTPGVVRRKDTAKEGNERDGVFVVIADRVDVPPNVTAR